MTKQWQPGEDVEFLLQQTVEERTERTTVGRKTRGNGEKAELPGGMTHCNFTANLAPISVGHLSTTQTKLFHSVSYSGRSRGHQF